MLVFLTAIAADLRDHWWLYLSMPVIAAVIGWVTKKVAVEMLFKPMRFVGIGPIGWQGMVPRRAAKMASIAVDTLTQNLLDPREILDRIDPEALMQRLQGPLEEAVDEVAREIARDYHPAIWERMPEPGRRLIIQRIHQRAPDLARGVLDEIRDDLERVLDVRHIAVSNLVRNKDLLNTLIRGTAEPEMRFIVRSGLIFGFGIGLVQASVWAATHSIWVMPVFGLFTGWFTDWLALKMIFEPKEPKRYLGIAPWHGLFLKRRDEFSADYARAMASEIFTPAVVMESLLTGPTADRLFAVVQREVQHAVDEEMGIARPVVSLAMGGQRYTALKRKVAEQAISRIHETAPLVQAYADEVLEIEKLIASKMQELTTEEYEGLLRPAFKEDEWIVIAVGALLGFLVGELQVTLVTHFTHF